jgi:phosphohistidine phosphatase
MQTARYYRSLLSIEADIIDHKWLYQEYLTLKFLDLIQKQNDNINSIMIIGHNPNISIMATNFNHSKNYQFAPGAIVKLDFDINNWSKLDIREGKESLFLK